ncbi:hypothetical protein TEA_012596 [Camellia sinensis var. sinensis]|uniref:Peroxidase n=1 Tax=Camellia sinensis var. sinensis TaxID=542762 RepID=A0A4S4F0P0_CAMSN|nr:hypothetical protein TEA_012596 [Camellia sinensis var. sinensis]
MEKKPILTSCYPTAHFQKLLMLLVIFIVSSSSSSSSSSSNLSFDFYAASCPPAELIVRNTVRSASSDDPSLPGKLLRLLFHDCFVEGCDASVLLEGNKTERTDPANTSLGGFSVINSAKRVLEIFCPETVSCADIVALAARDAVEIVILLAAEKTDPANTSLGGFSVINSAKRVLEIFCPGTVSCADIVALAARDAVEITGGPAIQIPTGRRDGRVSAASNVRPNIVDTSFSLDEMIKLFSSKGLSLDDLVTLSGAHTIGSAHCSAFSDRFQVDPKGNLTLIDSSLDKNYALELTKQCPAGASASITVNNDPGTPLLFDNQYYKELLAHKGLFQSDSVLLNDKRTMNRVVEFANKQASFFDSWGGAFLKLTSVGVKTGDEGEVRQLCSMTNSNG